MQQPGRHKRVGSAGNVEQHRDLAWMLDERRAIAHAGLSAVHFAGVLPGRPGQRQPIEKSVPEASTTII